jgi:CRISPR/Cas system-associated exonuclease Cas4 (RecB family)
LTEVIAKSEGYVVTDTLRGRHAWLYGICARKLHYASRTREIIRDDATRHSMDWGNKMHMLYEAELQNKWPEWSLRSEQNFTRELPEEIYGVKRVSITVDLVGARRVIEIKPRYNMPAYMQTLLQKFVLPDHDFMIYGYTKRELFPIKASEGMSKVYLGRFLTALHFLPPRVPNADPQSPPCTICQFKERCWREEDSTWETFKEQSAYAVEKAKSA